MKLNFALLGLLLLQGPLFAQDIVFFDGFENGTTNWILTGTYGLTGNAYQGSWCLNESPAGNYPNQTTMTATMANGIDMSTATESLLEFTAKYQIEYGFDFLYVEASAGGGVNWIPVATFTGDSLSWAKYTFSLGGFTGNPDVRVRFRFVSDDLLNYDGMRFDNVVVYISNVDQSPPLIYHSPLPHYEGHLGVHPVEALVTDISGVDSVWMDYVVDNVPQPVIQGTFLNGNHYLFNIPAQAPGAWVMYRFHAIDQAVPSNEGATPYYSYIAGNYIKYDDGLVDFIQPIGTASTSGINGAAVRITLGGVTNMVTALIRNYTDPNSINAQMLFHVWADNAGSPGADLITPFLVDPAANPASPSLITRIDLRPYAASLSALSGDVFVGFTVPSGSVWVTQSTPAVANRTLLKLNTIWLSSQDDFHFRVITSAVSGAPVVDFSSQNTADPQISFTDLSTGTPASWLWDFGDGSTSTLQNPQHIYGNNGTYNVGLTVTNQAGSATVYHLVTVAGCVAPNPAFDVDASQSPLIQFTQTSTGYPTTFSWNFGDGSPVMPGQQVQHTYSANGMYQVCLIVSNALGADTLCQTVVISSYTMPVASFGYTAVNPPSYQFVDMSSSDITNAPTSWLWTFGDGASSTQQNPLHTYLANGTYEICLVATNSLGSDTFCMAIPVSVYLPPLANFSFLFPNPNLPSVQFSDQSDNSVPMAPTAWSWDFGDGAVSTLQNPNHTFAQNGSYQVCLTVTNSEGSDSLCQMVQVSCYAIPQAAFTYNDATDPGVSFTDQSTGVPTSWLWVFEPNGAADVVANPFYTFTTNDTFQVCLTATNYLGTSTICHDVVINGYALPVAGFNYAFQGDRVVAFNDLSTNAPIAWEWTFGDGAVSSLQDPEHQYAADGTFQVCLTAANQHGVGATVCQNIAVLLSDQGLVSHSRPDVFPNPARQVLYYRGFQTPRPLVVRDGAGQVVLGPFLILSGQPGQVDVSGLPAGLYFLEGGPVRVPFMHIRP